MQQPYYLTFVLAVIVLLGGCGDDSEEDGPSGQEPMLRFVFQLDSTQQRLDNRGNPTSVPDSHAAQTPTDMAIAAHYIELVPDKNTWLGNGAVLYNSPQTTTGGDSAIVFDSLTVVEDGGLAAEVPLSEVPAGQYRHLRVSLAYQEFDMKLYYEGIPVDGRLASFIGYNNYITDYSLREQQFSVGGNRQQGYWGFAWQADGLSGQESGKAPATTVPNPLFQTAPVPDGSCVVTGSFAEPLAITGSASGDITVNMKVSIKRSLEWNDPNGNERFEPAEGEQPVDMGVRGLMPRVAP